MHGYRCLTGKSSQINGLQCLIGVHGPFEAIGLFARVSNATKTTPVIRYARPLVDFAHVGAPSVGRRDACCGLGRIA